MSGWDLLARTWDWEPSVVAGAALLLCARLALDRFRLGWRSAGFTAGVLVMLVALVSPLDLLGDEYLFSAHMLQHLLLDLVAPLLFVVGLSEGNARRLLGFGAARRAERVLGRPAVAWLLGVGTLWLWHWPPLYDATLHGEGVHVLEHLTFLTTGTILWWPVFTPLPGRRLTPLAAVAYLALAALANGLLGALFTFAARPFYAGYAHPADPLGVLPLLRGAWGLSRVADQQLGGAFMWVIGSVLFLGAIVASMARWYGEEAMPHDSILHR